MADPKTPKRPSVRDLADQGCLTVYHELASEDERRRLRSELYELLFPVLFGQLTRKIEARRGHRDCMASISSLRPDCLDRFHDDMDAVLDYVLRQARKPIHNLEGWATERLVPITVDAYRQRRGERGALQRPRIPKWLAAELDHDQSLLALAIEMLEWAGVDATAGNHDWPIEAWSARRTVHGVDPYSANRSVAHDVATVITAMNKRPAWYADYVERPMGRKRPPLAGARQDWSESAAESSQATEAEHAADDARRTELAALAVTLIEARLARDEDTRDVVIDVISEVFGSGTGSGGLDRLPGHDSNDDELVAKRLADPETVDRIIAVVIELLLE